MTAYSQLGLRGGRCRLEPPNLPESLVYHAWADLETPVGNLHLVASDAGLAAIRWGAAACDHLLLAPEPQPGHPVLAQAARELRQYFNGERSRFSVALAADGTEFQRQAWCAMRAIPWGQIRRYGEIAAQIGRPRAARAVGAAARCNPVPIVTPCHRVVGSDGGLTGFTGGLDVKRRLLVLEGSLEAADTDGLANAST